MNNFVQYIEQFCSIKITNNVFINAVFCLLGVRFKVVGEGSVRDLMISAFMDLFLLPADRHRLKAVFLCSHLRHP